MYHLARSCCALLAALTFSFVLSASQTASAQTCTSPPSGMIAWYPGDGNANDIQNGNNGTLQNGATYATGKVAQAFSLDGVNDYVSAPDSPSNRPRNLTIDGWFNLSSSTGADILVSKSAGTGFSNSYVLFLNNGLLQGVVGTTSDTGPILTAPFTPVLGTWYHIAYTFNDATDTQSLYVNGQQVATGTTTTTPGYDSNPLTLGVEFQNGIAENFFAGLIDEVEIFNLALSQAEIQAIYNADSAGKCKTGQTGQTAGDVVISEFRWDGPGGNASQQASNEFIELYNNTNSPITVSAPDNSGGWAVSADDATGTRFVIPAGTVIPARGHFLIVNSNGYSLSNYPAGVGTTATPDGTYTTDIPPNTGIALFRTANAANFSETTRLDAVGSIGGANFCLRTVVNASSTLYREGMGVGVYGSSFENLQYSLVRDLALGTPKDTGDNFSDFRLVETTANFTTCNQNLAATLRGQLGAPGPENTTSPIQRNATIKASLIDSMRASTASPNRVRSGVIVGPENQNNTRGTLKIRRKFTNRTGAPVTRLRLRVVDITTSPRPNTSTADLRVITDFTPASILLSDGQTSVPFTALSREEPPVQSTNGGGFNTTLSAALAQPIANNASINVEFTLGVNEDGAFRFLINVEALTGQATNPVDATKAGALGKALGSRKGK